MSGPILSRPVGVSDIHGPKDFAVVADPKERAALAVEYDLIEVTRLSAALTLAAEAEGAIAVSGRVSADIVQACVVSLVPVGQHIDEPVWLRFVRPGSPAIAPLKPLDEVVVDPTAPDPPEILTGGSIDLGQIVEEALVLAIDPYPRAPGAALPDLPTDDDPGEASPFAALAALKRPKR